jgi:transcriptional regulator GlxA family with amidase domain
MGANTLDYNPTDAELAFVRKAYEESAAFIAICGGFENPLRAGLLHGKTATAPRSLLGMLRENAPDVQWVEKRWHRDGKLWTSGALLNGADLMSAFITETWGGEGTLQDFMLKFGGVSSRDVDYKDVSWTM